MVKAFILLQLCALFCVAFANSRLDHVVPGKFMDDDDSFALEPVQVTVLADNLMLFKFGDEKNHGQRVWNHKKTEFSTLPRDFRVVGGYPSVFGGKVKKLSYAEATVQTDHNSATMKFVHFRTKTDDASYFRFIMEAEQTKTFTYNIEIFE